MTTHNCTGNWRRCSGISSISKSLRQILESAWMYLNLLKWLWWSQSITPAPLRSFRRPESLAKMIDKPFFSCELYGGSLILRICQEILFESVSRSHLPFYLIDRIIFLMIFRGSFTANVVDDVGLYIRLINCAIEFCFDVVFVGSRVSFLVFFQCIWPPIPNKGFEYSTV